MNKQRWFIVRKLAENFDVVFTNMGTCASPLGFVEISCGYLSIIDNSLNVCALINQTRSQNFETLVPLQTVKTMLRILALEFLVEGNSAYHVMIKEGREL